MNFVKYTNDPNEKKRAGLFFPLETSIMFIVSLHLDIKI